jgi:CheY-like chemotaxis protein
VNHTILIIDPYNLMGKLFALKLERECYDTTHTVPGTEEGLVFLKTGATSAIFICLRTMEMDATEFCRQLKTMPEFQQLPVLVWGALLPDKKLYVDLRQAGAAGYLSLPCSTEAIIAARDAVLSRQEFYPEFDDESAERSTDG